MTCDPQFYKETQRLFIQLHKAGLVYRAEAPVNYDPVDRTVLANEQVNANGFSWRSGAKVEKVKLKQWFVKTTEFAQRLLEDLKELEKDGKWPVRVAAMQRNWLGKSEGASFRFNLQQVTSGNASTRYVDVFTTRPDTMFGVKYIALSLEHPLVQELASDSTPLSAFIDSAGQFEPDSKAGFLLPEIKAENPIRHTVPDREQMEEVPVFVAPYVKSDYANAAVMGVPAHDARDFAFWKENNPPSSGTVKAVVLPYDEHTEETVRPMESAIKEAFTSLGTLSNECQQYAGLPSLEGGRQIVKDLNEVSDQLASFTTNWRLRDWLISRQRFWGTPIPIVHCSSCGTVPVPENQLPVELPVSQGKYTKQRGDNALERDENWRHTRCPNCGANGDRETDTMDTFVDSSWYYLSFVRAAENKDMQESYMPVDLYIGGVEHAILHLLYARFVAKFLAEKHPSSGSSNEPFSRLITQGMVHGRTFTDPASGQYLKADEIDYSDAQRPKIRSTGQYPAVSYEKMSKSKYNGADPSECMRKYGADATRAHVLFQAPVNEVLEWDEEKIVGIQRWFGRIWQLVHDVSPDKDHRNTELQVNDMREHEAELWKLVQSTIVSVNQSFSSTFTLNTVVSDLMRLTNAINQTHASLSADSTILYQSCTALLRLLTPITPSFAEECWLVLHDINRNEFNVENTASRAGFPQPDGSLEKLEARSQPCAVQVNGKLKFATRVATPPDGCIGEELKDWVLRRVFESEEGAAALAKSKWDVNEAKRIVIAKSGRTINIVF